MKITNFTLTSEQYTAGTILLSLKDISNTNPYQIRNVDGLDGGDILQKFQAIGSSGSHFYGFSLDKRDIVILIGLNADAPGGKSYSDLRDDLYRLIATSRSGYVNVGFRDGIVLKAVVRGFVTKFEAVLFSDTPAVKLTISCDDPLLYSPGITNVATGGFDATSFAVIDSTSTAPHGISMTVTFTANSDGFLLGNQQGLIGEFMQILPTGLGGFLTDDVLTLGNEKGAKTLSVRRAGFDTNLADAVTPGSIWPSIFPGLNTFVCLDTPLVINALSYYSAFWGI